MRNIFTFLRKVTLTDKTKKINYLEVIFLFVLSFFLDILIIFLIHLIDAPIPQSSNNMIYYTSTWYLALIPVVLVPILEETGCRAFLKYSFINIYLSTSLIIFFLISLLSGFKIYVVEWHVLWIAIVALCIGLVPVRLLNKIPTKDILNFYKSRAIILFYSSAVIFALFHLSNFKLHTSGVFVALLLILPQFISGVIYGYVRVKNGISVSIALHAFHNLFILIISSN